MKCPHCGSQNVHIQTLRKDKQYRNTLVLLITLLAVITISVIGGSSTEPPIFLYFTGFFGLFGVCTASKTSAIFLPKIASKTSTTTCLTTFVTKKLYSIRVFDTWRFLFYAK